MFTLSLAATIALLFNMISIPLFKSDLLDKVIPSTILEYILLVCFFMVFLFNSSCFIWGCKHSKSRTDSMFSIFVLIASVICIIMMFGEKTILDEISKEYQLNLEVNGKWLMLYLLFLLQLAFNAAVIIKLKSMPETA